MGDIKDYRSLAAAMILLAVKEKDARFFGDKQAVCKDCKRPGLGKEICELLNIHPDKALKTIESKKKVKMYGKG